MSSLRGRLASDDLERDLISNIQEGKLRPGDPILPIRQLSKRYHISYNTTRKALGSLVERGFLVSQQGKGVFVAERNSFDKAQNIGFIFCTNFGKMSSDPFLMEVFNGIQKEGLNRKFRINVFSVDEESQKKLLIPDFIKERDIEGLLVMGLITTEYIFALKKRNIPMVLIDNYTIEGIDAILTDNLHSSFKAVQYLYGLGHRKIGCICPTNPRLPHISERLMGYKLALDEHTIEYDDSLVQQVDFISDKGYLAMKKILEAPSLPTAIFAGNDIVAINAMKAIKAKNLRIPEDISIIGFDDIESALHTDPPLTTMRVTKEEMGKIAIAKLLDILEGKTKKTSHLKIMAEIIERDSCRKI